MRYLLTFFTVLGLLGGAYAQDDETQEVEALEDEALEDGEALEDEAEAERNPYLETSTNRQLSIAGLFSPITVGSPFLSPDGTRLVISSEAPVLDEFGQQEDMQYAIRTFLVRPDGIEAQSAFLYPDPVNWVRWANDDKLLISTRSQQEMEEGVAFFLDEEGTIVVTTDITLSYLVSINPDGSDPVPMYLGRGRELSLNQTGLSSIVDMLPHDPDHILMEVRSRSRGTLDVYRVNIHTGVPDRVDRGRSTTVGWFANSEGVTVMRLDLVNRYRELAVLIRERDGQLWRRVAQQSISNFSELQEGVEWVARTQAVDKALVFTPHPESGTIALMEYDLEEGALGDAVFHNPDYDVANILTDPLTAEALAVSWADERNHIVSFDPRTARHLAAIADFMGEGVTVFPIQRAGDTLLLEATGPQLPSTYMLYNFPETRLEPLGPFQAELNDLAFSPVEVHTYTASDGTQLFGYLTRPVSWSFEGKALVVLPHGGPEARDYYAFDQIAQLLAARGYFVFQPQFRGSAGFGPEFAEAGHGEWAGLIQSDIAEGARSVMAAEAIDSERVCVVGISFGGYAALMQPIVEPELYRCAAAGAAVTDLPEMLAWEEERAEARLERVRSMFGTATPGAMENASPTRRADELTLPVLLLHGEDDQIVPLAQSELMYEALQAVDADVELVTFEGGHNLATLEEMEAFMSPLLGFLYEHLVIGAQTEP